MSPTVNLYLKALIRFGVSFALLMLFFDIIEGDVRSLVKYFFLLVFFGGFMSALLVGFHISKVKELLGKSDLTDEDLATQQSRTIVSADSPDDILEKIKSTTDFKIKSIQKESHQISFRRSTSWYSWGENIKITWSKLSDNQYQYEVSSQPKLFLQFVDYGINLENIQRIERLIV